MSDVHLTEIDAAADDGVPGWEAGDMTPPHQFVAGDSDAEHCAFMLKRFKPGPNEGIICGGPTSDPAHFTFSFNLPGVTDDVDLATQYADISVATWFVQNRADLERCSMNDAMSLLLRVGLTFLVSNGLATIAPEGSFQRWLDAEIEEPYAGQIQALLADAVARGPVEPRQHAARLLRQVDLATQQEG